MQKTVEKVVAYVTREIAGVRQVLVFTHRAFREAGVQVPAGSVEPGENIEQALLREVQEESGLVFHETHRFLGRFEWLREDRNELHFRNVFQICAPVTMDDKWSHTVEGHGDDSHMVFDFYWLPVAEAETILAVDQGLYLDRLG